MFTQITLDYAFSELEPVLDTLTMETHYGKHHAAYTKAFNEAAEKAGLADKSAEEILGGLSAVADEALRTTLRNQGGGYYNHNLYFQNFAKDGGDATFAAEDAATKAFAEAVTGEFGGLDGLKEKLSAAAVGQFGSGWAFLSVTSDGKLVVTKSANQDNPISEGTGNRPILALDVWEHAYYLQYKNLRADYVKAYFGIVDWRKVAALYRG